MNLTRNDVKIGSIIETTGGTIFKVTNPDHKDGAMCVKVVKTTGKWTKKESAFKYGEYSQIVRVNK